MERFRTQKTAAVLALLALRGSQSRELLCALLWPDSPPEAARSSLSSALTALRRDLGEQLLVADRYSVALAPGSVTTDVAEFDEALRQSDWARAVELYRGPLLPGFYEEPFPALAGEYEEKARGAFEQRLQVLEGAGGAPGAAEPLRALARRASALFGEEERWLLALMRAHRMAGDADAALRAYEALLRHARKAGDVASEEARQLAKALRRERELGRQAVSAQAAQEPEAEAEALQVLEAPQDAREAAAGAVRNLPAQWTRFFGRQSERELLRSWLESGETLVTLSGPGGSGKTRLAIEAVREAASSWGEGGGSVTFVPLAALSDAQLLFATIRDALGVAVASDLPPLEQIERALAGQKCLLLLDNFEQLTEAGAPLLQQLRARLPQATLLVASRVLLRLPGERELAVAPLPTPLPSTALAEAEATPSVALFLDRAGIALDASNAEAVGALCRRLDGIPLALELAAARAKVLAPSQILERLSTHPDLLKSRERGIPERHKTLRAAIEWSADLLSPELRRLFARACVFRGGWALEAAEAVCAPGVCEPWEALDFLESLRDHSLLITEEAGAGTRYRLLETLREWGQAQLAPEEKAALEKLHFEFYLARAEGASDAASLMLQGEALEREVANFRAALSWALAQPDASLSARLAGALGPFWEVRSHFSEGCDWLGRALEKVEGAASTCSGPSAIEDADRARLWCAAGTLFVYGGDMARAQEAMEESVALYRALDDERGEAQALDTLGKAQMVRGQCDAGRRNGERAMEIARAHGDIGRLASAIVTAGWGYLNTYRFEECLPVLDEGIAIAEAISQPRLRAVCLSSKALALSLMGDDAGSEAINGPLVATLEGEADAYARVFLRGIIGIMACDSGRFERCRALLPQATRDFLTIGARWEFANGVIVSGELALFLGQPQTAALLMGAGEAICERASYVLAPCLVRQYDAALIQLKAELDPATLAEEWARGRRLSDEEAVAVTQQLA